MEQDLFSLGLVDHSLLERECRGSILSIRLFFIKRMSFYGQTNNVSLDSTVKVIMIFQIFFMTCLYPALLTKISLI